MEAVTGVLDYLLANPIYLVPILSLIAMLLYALLKRLIKLAVIAGIAGVLYIGLVEYFGVGF